MPRILCAVGLGLFCLAIAGAAELPVKPCSTAGSWYPEDPIELARVVDRLMDGAGLSAELPPQRLRALISPHAGYQYSGATAAHGYRLLRGSDVRRVVLIGPSHRGGFRGLSIPEVREYQTPLGGVPLDRDAAERLRRSALVGAWSPAHRYEHSLEIQLPFLQRALQPGWQLVPVLVGELEHGDHRRAADLLRPLADQRTLFIVSSDFTHYGPRFGYSPFPPDLQVAQRLRELDMGALERIRARDPEGFTAYLEETGATVCGADAVRILLEMLPETSRVELLDYSTSGALSGTYRSSVSYLSIAILDDRPWGAEPDVQAVAAPQELSREHLDYLYRLALYAIHEAVDPGNGAGALLQRLLTELPARLREPAGAFVTVLSRGRLRGCKGHVEPMLPLYEAVIRNGVSAALNDWRFGPLAAGDLEDLEIHLSVLSVPMRIASYRDYRPGEQGIVLIKDGRRAVFLPEVPTIAGWDRTRTLEELARKAGLPGDAWKDGAELLVFRTQVYDSSIHGPVR
jgi:AmmeMemoRadiSam system protein B/AmmeMemoRadiSam system protein A